MKYLSLFSGVGGLDLGLDRAGMECVAQCEIDPFARAVLERHWPGIPKYTDVTKLCRRIGDCLPESEDGEVECPRCGVEFGKCDCIGTDQFTDQYGFPDVLVGGFPCQDLSVAGKGAGLAGAKSGLWFEMLRIITELRPRWIIAENVPALRTRGADTVLEGLEGLRYTTWPVVVGVDDCGGPHRRKRVFLVANANDSAGSTEQLPKRSDQKATIATRSSGCDFDKLGGCGRCVACLADAERAGLEGGRANPGQPQVAESRHSGPLAYTDNRAEEHKRRPDGLLWGAVGEGRGGRIIRWPSGPGQSQYGWEEPRTVELPLGSSTDGVSSRLVRFANKNALRAYGNSVSPAVAEVIGRAVMAVDKQLKEYANGTTDWFGVGIPHMEKVEAEGGGGGRERVA